MGGAGEAGWQVLGRAVSIWLNRCLVKVKIKVKVKVGAWLSRFRFALGPDATSVVVW